MKEKDNLGKLIVRKAENEGNYVKAIKMKKGYEDGRSFPLNEIIVADKKINLRAEDKDELGGINVSNYENVIRWIIRGDTLCDVTIPDDGNIYETVHTATNHGTFRADKIILSNPRIIDDELALDLYKRSNLPWKSYIQILSYISTLDFRKTCDMIVKDRINKDNAQEAIEIFDNYLERRSNPMPELYVEILERLNKMKME